MEKLKYDGNQITSWDKCDWRPQETEKPKQGTLKLSEAIRIGAALRPQGRGHAFKEGRSCAWGAAWEGSGHEYNEAKGYAQIAVDLWTLHKGAAMGTDANGVNCSISTMNDSGRTREQIADWLEAQGY